MEILLDVIEVKPRNDYMLELTFENGDRRRFDMKPLLDKKPFGKLRPTTVFNMAKIDYGTVVWPNGVDIAPETLWEDSIPIQ